MKNNNIFAPVNLALIVINLIVLNLVAVNVFSRLDLTENKVYSLSDVTRDIIQNLEEPLTIKAYFTRDLPVPYNNISRFVEDNLAEMKAYGRGKFRYEFLDPEDEEDLRKEAESFRLEPLQVNEMRADRVEIKLAFMGMVLIYEDRQEVIPVVQSLENLEYEIVSKIKLVTAEEERTIGFVQGHGEANLREGMTRFDRELRKIYALKPVDFSIRNSIPADIDLLCLIGPKEDIPEKDRFTIDQFIMRGGKLLMCVNKVNADLQTMSATRGKLRIDPWTESYGFRFEDNLVMDRQAPTLPFQTMTRYGRQITYVVYPLFPEIINFNREHIAMKVLRQVRLYFPSSIDTSFAADLDGVTVEPLFWSSEKSALQMAPYDINPLTQRGKFIFDQTGQPLGILLSGTFNSYWKDETPPLDDDGNPITEEEILTESVNTRMVVIADANFLQDQYLVPGLDNLTMGLNLIDWLGQDEELITIRSKEVGSRPIKTDVTDATRRTVKYVNMLIPPLLVILFGMVRWRRKKAARKTALRNMNVDNVGGNN